MTVRVSLADLRALETIAPDPRSTTRFAPFVSMPPEWRDAFVAAVEAAQESLGNLIGDLYLHRLGEITDEQLWASGDREETAARVAFAPFTGQPEGDA